MKEDRVAKAIALFKEGYNCSQSVVAAFADEGSRETVRNNGILFSSGMIAGEGLVGILLAVLAVFGVSDRINLGLMGFHLGKWGGCLFFLALLFSMIYMIHKTKDKQSSNNTL